MQSIMIQECLEYLLVAASNSQGFGNTFVGIQFEERTQAMEVFALQSLSMCSSHCRAAALLLQNDLLGEAISVLRSIQELLFDLYWIRKPTNRKERLERVYQLEATPYAHWDKETKLISQCPSLQAFSIKMRISLDEIADKYTFLTKINPDGSKSFKQAPPFSQRMEMQLRAKYYHIYCYSSLFVHPTPMVKDLYLKTSNSVDIGVAYEEALQQFVAYSLLFVTLIMGYAEATIGSFAPSAKERRDALYTKMIETVKRANKGYFS